MRSTASSPFFAPALTLVGAVEGGLSMDPNDPGNWTGGACGSGQLKGTKFGISAASYPELDIAALTAVKASAILERDFFDAFDCGSMPWRWCLTVFDGAVNQGGVTTVKRAQLALQTTEDGDVGPETLAAMSGPAAEDAYQGFVALRAEAGAGLQTHIPRHCSDCGFESAGRHRWWWL